MAELPTNFKDDILAEAMGGRRRYQMIQNEDGTVSFVDVTQYEQIGSDFGQAEINQTNEEVNKKFDSGDVVDPVTTTELGFAADAKLTGDALKELNAKMEWVKIYEGLSANVQNLDISKYKKIRIKLYKTLPWQEYDVLDGNEAYMAFTLANNSTYLSVTFSSANKILSYAYYYGAPEWLNSYIIEIDAQ